jgi:hypothetical protein
MEVRLEKFSSKDISKIISWIPDKEVITANENMKNSKTM